MPAPILPPGPVRPCTHAEAHHPHGHRMRYTHDRCRCDACRKAQRDYQADMRRARAYGVPRNVVDARPSREHVQALQAAGMGLGRITEVSGVASSVLQRLLYGDFRGHRSRHVWPSTEARLLAVQPDPALVPSLGARRRVQALIYQGWTLSRLAGRLGCTPSNLRRSINGEFVSRRRATEVAAMYDELWNVAPPIANGLEAEGARRARSLARSRGWVPPLAWDEDAIDDPNAGPDVGEYHYGFDLDEWAYLIRTGATLDQSLTRCGISIDAIYTAARRQDRLDILALLRQHKAAA